MVILVLVFAFILRLININQSLWLDEAVQAITAAGPLSGILPELIGDFHPPLYHYFMWCWVHLFGSSEIILRLPSVLFGVGTVYFGYKIGSMFENQELRIKNKALTILLFATSPYLIYYSQEARMYSMAAFLATLSSYIFIKLFLLPVFLGSSGVTPERLQNPDSGQACLAGRQARMTKIVKNYLPYLLVNIALVYTDYYGWLVVLAQSLILIYRKSWKGLILNSVFFLLVYLPWMNMLITQIKAGVQATQTLPVWASLVNISAYKAIPLTFIKFTIGRISFPDKQFYLLVVLLLIGIYSTLVIFGIKGWFKIRRYPNVRYVNILIYYTCLWLVVPLTIAWLVSFQVPNFQPFRLLLILPAFHILTIYLISNIPASSARQDSARLAKRGEHYPLLRKTVIGLVLIINLCGYLYFQLTPSMHREDWRGLTRYTDSQNATLLLPSESSNWPVRYYTKGGTQLVRGATGAEKVSCPPALSGATIYYIRYLVPVFDPGERLQTHLNLSGYQKTDTINFNQLEIWKYEWTLLEYSRYSRRVLDTCEGYSSTIYNK